MATCQLDARVGEVRDEVEASRYGFAFVVTRTGVLLGRLRRAALEDRADPAAEDVMEPGPSTIRPDVRLAPLAQRMRSRKLTSLPITTPEGRLLGLARRDDVEAALDAQSSTSE